MPGSERQLKGMSLDTILIIDEVGAQRILLVGTIFRFPTSVFLEIPQVTRHGLNSRPRAGFHT